MYSEDYEIDDISCPKCGTNTRSRRCSSLYCDDGEIDEYEDDPINFAEGEAYSKCEDCYGTGIERWCPDCGWQWKGESLKEYYL